MSWLTRLIARFRKPIDLPPLPRLDHAPAGVTLVPAPFGYVVNYQQAQAAPWQPEPSRPGIKPPDVWQWSEWQKEAAIHARAGWCFCRFANRGDDDTAPMVLGYVRPPFGVYEYPGEIHYWDYDTHHTEDRVVAMITHLPTGIGMGVFLNCPDAMEAAELADKLSPDWYEGDQHQLMRARADRVRQGWIASGTTPIGNGHVVIQGHRRELWQFQQPMFGRPEKLS